MVYGARLAVRVNSAVSGFCRLGWLKEHGYVRVAFDPVKGSDRQDYKKANVGGNPAELAEARRALEICHVEVKRLVAAKKAIKSEKLETTILRITTPADRQPLGNSTRSSAAGQTWRAV